MRNVIPTRVHGMLDYVVGLLLIASPWLFGFADDRAAMAVPVVLGAGALLYSLMTRYELGLFPVIPMSAHLGIDFVSGLILLASPWTCGFADRVMWPHVPFGIMEIGVVLLSSRVPTRVSATDHGHGHMGRHHTA